MFYIKSELPSGRVAKTEITDKNVFTHCVECGRELPIDLAEVFNDGEGDLFSTNIVCSSCTKKHCKASSLTENITITLDGLNLLVDVMNKAGYGEPVYDLFMRHEIDELKDLSPEQYTPFADALCEMATGEFSL
jgi:hypothetical protein